MRLSDGLTLTNIDPPAKVLGPRRIYRTYYEHGINTIPAIHLDHRDPRELEVIADSGVIRA